MTDKIHCNATLTIPIPTIKVEITVHPPSILLLSDPFLIKSVVTLVEKTNEGHIIELIYPAWNDIIDCSG